MVVFLVFSLSLMLYITIHPDDDSILSESWPWSVSDVVFLFLFVGSFVSLFLGAAGRIP